MLSKVSLNILHVHNVHGVPLAHLPDSAKAVGILAECLGKIMKLPKSKLTQPRYTRLRDTLNSVSHTLMSLGFEMMDRVIPVAGWLIL